MQCNVWIRTETDTWYVLLHGLVAVCRCCGCGSDDVLCLINDGVCENATPLAPQGSSYLDIARALLLTTGLLQARRG